jgi:hypothetical protein
LQRLPLAIINRFGNAVATGDSGDNDCLDEEKIKEQKVNPHTEGPQSASNLHIGGREEVREGEERERRI